MEITVRECIEELLKHPMDSKMKFEIESEFMNRKVTVQALNHINFIDANGSYPDTYVIVRGK